MNAMQKAFEAAGLRPEDVALDKAIALYLNSGGTIERARARLDVAAARMPGMDQAIHAHESQSSTVQTRQPAEEGRAIECMSQDHAARALPSSPLEDGEATFRVPQGHNRTASPSSPIREPARLIVPQGQSVDAASREPNRGGRDHDCLVQKSQCASVPPVREPPKPARGVAAIASAQAPIKRAFLFTYKTSDGTLWGKVCWNELYGMKRDGGVAGGILARHEHRVSPKQRFSPLDEILTDAEFMEIYNVAQNQIEAAV